MRLYKYYTTCTSEQKYQLPIKLKGKMFIYLFIYLLRKKFVGKVTILIGPNNNNKYYYYYYRTK